MIAGRIANLLATFFSYKKYGIFLLREKNGVISALNCCDDLGFFTYVPMISSALSIDPIIGSKILFFGIIGLFFTVVGISFIVLSRTINGYGVITLGLYRLIAPLRHLNDVYIAYILPFLAIPLLLLALEKKHKKLFLVSFFIAGLTGGIADVMRIYAFLPVIVFFLIILIFNSTFRRYKKILPLLALMSGYAIPYAHFKYVIHKRDTFLEQRNAKEEETSNMHVFWHNMYIGFGYLANKHDITWNDSCGEAHAREVIPGVEVGTQAYERTIRNLIFNLIKTDRYFVFITLFAKLGAVLFFFFLYLGFLGLFAAYFVPKAWYIELAFLCCAGVGALPGILTLPETAYLMGFITCTALYTMYSIIYFLNNNGFERVKKSYKSIVNTIKSTE